MIALHIYRFLFLVIFNYACFFEGAGQGINLSKNGLLIDDFEVNLSKSPRGGKWFTFTDSANGGKSKISSVSQAIQNGCLGINYNLNKDQFKWNPYVAWGVSLVDSQVPGSINRYKAVAYKFKGGQHIFSLQFQHVVDYAHYQKVINASEQWTTVVIPFDQLKQPSWGRPEEFLLEELKGLLWQVSGNTLDSGQVSIDEVRLLKQLPKPTVKQEQIIEIKKDQVFERKKCDFVTIGEWFNFSKASYSLTFDDGLRSQYLYAFPILQRYDLSSTFYIVPPMLADDKSTPTWRYGSWKEFLEIAHHGHEIGTHSMTHQKLTEFEVGSEKTKGTLLYELVEPINILKLKIPRYQATSVAYPYTDFNDLVSSASSNYYIAGRGGIGTVGNLSSPENMTALQASTIQYSGNRDLQSDLSQIAVIQKIIENNIIQNKRWGIWLAHDVLPLKDVIAATDSWHPVSEESFEEFAKWLQSKVKTKELWVSSVGKISKYIKERDRASIEVIEQSTSHVTLKLSDGLPDDLFDQPLSLQFGLPLGWNSVQIVINNKSISHDIEERLVRFNAIPDRGLIVINKLN